VRIKMHIDVPLVRQPKDSLDCGIAGMAMILQYYGFKDDFLDIQNEIPKDEIGTYAPQLGSFLIKKGFEVTIITMHPALFTLHDKDFSKDEFIERFENLMNKSDARNKKVLMFFIQFIKDGGKILIKIPDEHDIKKEIAVERPVGALLTTNFMNANFPKFNFHFNLITGIDDEHIYANDPMWDERGGKKKYLKKDFFFGLYASSFGDLDNGCLILAKKK
jgi:hypothetical protein